MIINKNIFPGEGFADPHAIVENDKVYIFSGRDASPKIEDFCRMNKWTIISSSDLVNWKKENDILPTDTYIGNKEHCWAGHIKKKNDTFYWYFSNKNINIGVMSSKSVTGPYIDALNAPLIPEHFINTPSYDPCVYEENGEYTIFFGAGNYYCCTLGENMISLSGSPQKIIVIDEQGNHVSMDDKSTVFKNNDWYYLCCGNRYAMSKSLKGPYVFKGEFIGGGHNDHFIFKNEHYLCYEFHDTNIYYRGIALIKLDFNQDGTVKLPSDNPSVFYNKRIWNFENDNTFHWFLTNGNDITYGQSGLLYALNSYIGVRSPIFPGIKMYTNYTLVAEIENTSESGSLKFMIDKANVEYGFAKYNTIETTSTVLPLQFGTQLYKINIINEKISHLKCIRIFGAGPEDKGTIHIKSVAVLPE